MKYHIGQKFMIGKVAHIEIIDYVTQEGSAHYVIQESVLKQKSKVTEQAITSMINLMKEV